MVFKKTFINNAFSIIAISGLIYINSVQVHADEVQRPVFRQVPASEQSKEAPVNPLIVKRQRTVAIQLEAFKDSIEKLNLNLFDNAKFKVIKKRLRQNRKNQYTWKGHIDGVKKSRVVLVMDPTTKQMSGTVKTVRRTFHIRPNGQGEHVVQEIDSFLTDFPLKEDISDETVSRLENNDSIIVGEDESEEERPHFFDQEEENEGETVVEEEAPDSVDSIVTGCQPRYRRSNNRQIAHFNRLLRKRYQWLRNHGRRLPFRVDQTVPEEITDLFPHDAECNEETLPGDTEVTDQTIDDGMNDSDIVALPEEDESITPVIPVDAEPVDEGHTDEMDEPDSVSEPEIPTSEAVEENETVTNSDDVQESVTPVASFEQRVLVLVNQERAKRNLHPLVMDSQLTQSARAHSADMAELKYFSHTSLDGRSAVDRINDTGYQGNAWGENIAFGQTTPEEVMNGWMNSPGHAANILNQNFCDIGIGYEPNGRYWTQNFGRKRGVSQCQ